MRQRIWGVVLALGLAGCGEPTAEETRAEAARLRATWAGELRTYRASVEEANRLRGETLEWLEGPAVRESRSRALAGVRVVMEKWARVHFVPRVLHERLRNERYRSAGVRAAQERILEHLRASYVEWHLYQRYAQRASETGMHGAPAGRLSPQLEEFRARLEGRKRVVDEITPVLAELPR